MALSAARRSARMAEPLVYQLNELGKAVQGLGQNQHQLAGGLQTVSKPRHAPRNACSSPSRNGSGTCSVRSTTGWPDNALKVGPQPVGDAGER